MLDYYLRCALQKTRRHPWLASSLVLIIGLGVAACMTTLSVLRAATRDPMPWVSRMLYAPSIASTGEAAATFAAAQGLVDHATAVRLLSAGGSTSVFADYALSGIALPQDPGVHPSVIYGHAVSAAFFPVLRVPFVFGRSWSASEEGNHDLLVVISRKLNDRIFSGRDSVGRTLRYNDATFRVVGVMDDWEPSPRFYDINAGNGYPGTDEDFLVPLESAVANRLGSAGTVSCVEAPDGKGFDALLHSGCLWISVIAMAPTQAGVHALDGVLDGAVRTSVAGGLAGEGLSGRMIPLRSLMEAKHIVPDGTQASVVVSVALFLGCLVTAASLMMSHYLGRHAELGLRRALGARRTDIVAQLLVEAALTGLLGGLVGIGLTFLGVATVHRLLPSGPAQLATLQAGPIAIALLGALVATMLSGAYPALSASRAMPLAIIRQG